MKPSYSVLQDDFFQFMRSAGYDDVERGERGSTEEHLTVTQFKVAQETRRLEAVTAQLGGTTQAAEKKKQELKDLQKRAKEVRRLNLTVQDIEDMGKANKFTGNVTLTASECDTLKSYAENSFLYKAENQRLREKLTVAQKSAARWKKQFEELKEKAQPYLDALEVASEKVRAFIAAVLARGKEKQEQKHPVHRCGRDMEI